MRNLKIFALIVIFIALLCRLDRHFLKKNQHFSVHTIQSTLPKITTPPPQENVSLDAIFNQPFYYLSKGHQSFVFLSADKQFVLKFYRFPSHMRSFYWLIHPWPDALKPERIHVQQYNRDKLTDTLNSYTLAYEDLNYESALIMIHLNQTDHLKRRVTIVDTLRQRYVIDLDQTCFIVQKKAQPLFPVLESLIEKGELEQGKQMIDSIFTLIRERCKKGITDLDAILEKNYGWCEGRAIHVDVGRFVKQPTDTQAELIKITESLQEWLRTHSPPLHAYYQQQLENIALVQENRH